MKRAQSMAGINQDREINHLFYFDPCGPDQTEQAGH